MAETPHHPVVTIAALYGASGSVIGPRVAESLEVPLLDREIPAAVAGRTGLTDTAVMSVDQEPRSGVQRLMSSLGRTATVTGGAGRPEESLDLEEHRLRGHIEDVLAEAAISGGVVIGRGGMIVLGSVPWALHVFLGGPREARIQTRMTLDGIDRATAERRQQEEDRYRIAYVRRAYGVDGIEPDLYHLMIDTTALDVGTCVDLIVAASRSRTRRPTS